MPRLSGSRPALEPAIFAPPLTRKASRQRRGIGISGSSSPAGWAQRLRDPFCIALVGAICSAAYVMGLRLYSDDWFFIEPLMLSRDQSWPGLYRALAETPFVGVRPVQILWYIAFHKLAPGQVAPVHLANHAVFAASSLVLYAALRATPATRRAAYYVAMLYVCLPTFSVAKMWYANHQAVLGLLLFALTWLLTARIALTGSRVRWLLVPAAGIATAIGNLAYELFAVTALALPLFVWSALGIRGRALARDRAFLAATAAIGVGFAATTLFKLTYDYGVELPATLPAFVRSATEMYATAAKTTFWTLGVYSPRAAVGILGGPYLQPGATLAPLAVLVVLVLREWLAGRTRAGGPEAGIAFVAASGLIAFVLGYVPYLANFLYSPKPWGEGNRGNIAAALGAALLIYAAFRWLCDRQPLLARTALIGFCTIGAFLQVAVGRTWVGAAAEQDRRFAQFERIARDELEDRGAALVYGTCPYFGAGPVFPYGWDLTARLRTESAFRHLRVDLVRPEMRIGADGLSTPRNRWGSKLFGYGALRIVDMGDGSMHAIGDAGDARRFFAARPLERAITCPADFGVGNPLY